MKNPLVLASSSPIRLKLLKNAGVDVVAQPVHFDEMPLKNKAIAEGWPAKRLAIELAEAKAMALADSEDSRIIGADQVLELDGVFYNKPQSKEDAISQLKTFSGKTHRLYSAVAVVKNGAVLFHHIDMVSVHFRPLSDELIMDYVNHMGDELLETVGAYKLEGRGVQLMEKIDGDYFTVLGLPLLPLLGFFRQTGVTL